MRLWGVLLVLGCGAAKKPVATTSGPSAKVAAILAEVDAKLVDHARSINDGAPRDPRGVARQLAVLASSDRYLRTRPGQPDARELGELDKDVLKRELRERLDRVVETNTDRLAELLAIHGWFKISEFGAEADKDAWILVDHADDPMLQRGVLGALELLWPEGETNAQAYAYLYDRVAVDQGRGQHYGTQGRCAEKGKWEPYFIEGEGFVDQRRAEVGLGPMEAQKQMNAMTCD